MKNETLILGGVMLAGMGYLGYKNKEALGEMAGKLSVGSSGGSGGVDLSFLGEAFKALGEKGSGVVQVVKDGAGNLDLMSFGEDIKKYVDDGINNVKTYVSDKTDFGFGGIGDGFGGIGDGFGGIGQDFQEGWEWFKGGVKNNPVAKTNNLVATGIDTFGHAMGGILIGTPQMLMSKLGFYDKSVAQNTVNNLNKIFPRNAYGGSYSSNPVTQVVQNTKDKVSNLTNITSAAGSVKNNRKNTNKVVEFVKTKSHGTVSQSVHDTWKKLGII